MDLLSLDTMLTHVLKLTLEYDGTRYRGWQSQQNSRAVQDAVISAAREVLDTEVELGGAGRTDAGVHALAQVAHLRFRGGRNLAPGLRSANAAALAVIRDRLNRALPSDVAVLSVEAAAADFHARHGAVRRYYLYQVSTRKSAFSKKFAWWVGEPLDVRAMKQAADLLPGRHDFVAFGEKGGEKKSTLVEVYDASLLKAGDLILCRIGASHFLWKMVRRVVGSLVEIGRGNLKLEAFREMLQQGKGSAAPWTAPAAGLFLERVTYADDDRPGKLQPVLWA